MRNVEKSKRLNGGANAADRQNAGTPNRFNADDSMNEETEHLYTKGAWLA